MVALHRRVFYGKVGTGGQLAEHVKQGLEKFRQYGLDLKGRVLVDHMSGRTDRVIAEWEGDSAGEIETGINKVMSDPEAQKVFGPWFQKLSEMIHYAEAENWDIV